MNVFCLTNYCIVLHCIVLYSQTCVKQTPKGKPKSGCLRQVLQVAFKTGLTELYYFFSVNCS